MTVAKPPDRTISRLRKLLKRPPDPQLFIQATPSMVDVLRDDYKDLTEEPRSLTVTSWPVLVADTLDRIGGRAFAGISPTSGIPNRPGAGALATAAIRIGLEEWIKLDPGVELAMDVGLEVAREEGGTKEARRLVMGYWRSLDAVTGGGLEGVRRNLWLGGGIAGDVYKLAGAIGVKPAGAVAAAAACAALACEPAAIEEERQLMAQAAVDFIMAVRLKASSTAALTEVLL